MLIFQKRAFQWLSLAGSPASGWLKLQDWTLTNERRVMSASLYMIAAAAQELYHLS